MQPTYAQLDGQQAKAFDLYKTNSPHLDQICFADFINDELRHGRTLPSEWEQQAIALDSIFQMSSMDEDTLLFRATNLSLITPFIAEGVFTYPAYMSTASHVEAVEPHFGNPSFGRATLLEIECSPGTSALDMELNLAHGGHEAEFLFKRGSRFEVKRVYEGDSGGLLGGWSTAFPHRSPLLVYEVKYISQI